MAPHDKQPHAMGIVEDELSEGEKDELEQAAINNERAKTKYGAGLPDDHRDTDNE